MLAKGEVATTDLFGRTLLAPKDLKTSLGVRWILPEEGIKVVRTLANVLAIELFSEKAKSSNFEQM